MSINQLSSLQLELLKSFALNPSDEDLIFVRKVLAAYFSTKSKAINANDLEEWFNKSSVEIITPKEIIHPPTIAEPLTNYHKSIISKQSKHALAKAVAKEEPLILE